jgi:RNA polymerase sigma factor (sigma-70 family)
MFQGGPVPRPKSLKLVAPSSDDPAWSGELDGAYRSHVRWLVAFLGRRFGREIAEDLAQETFLRLAKTPLQWRNPKSVLARTALNVAQDHLRHESAQRRPRLVSDVGVRDAFSMPDQIETLFHREVVGQLPRNLRDVYCLNRFGGMTYDEIATHIGISVKAVEKRMTKALKICVARYRA